MGIRQREAMLGLISMRVELGVAKKEQVEDHVVVLLQRHICADAHGNPVDFKITGGEVHDSKVAHQLIDLLEEAEYFIADKGYDSDAIREKAREAEMTPVIPRRSNSAKPNTEFDAYL